MVNSAKIHIAGRLFPPFRILRNEIWLRKSQNSEWSQGLVRFSSQMDSVCPRATLKDTERILVREDMNGYKILDSKRPSSISIQRSVEQFASTFNHLSDGLLQGLDWTNVFVAGGMALGSLLCTNISEDGKKYVASDIDIYLYGLGPIEANDKIRSIYEVWRSNLPPQAPSAIVRNSRTITLFSEYPLKRIQIVLKLVKDPKEVLLNFDLDVCAVGWDGSEVWLLPRAVRALESESSNFSLLSLFDSIPGVASRLQRLHDRSCIWSLFRRAKSLTRRAVRLNFSTTLVQLLPKLYHL